MAYQQTRSWDGSTHELAGSPYTQNDGYSGGDYVDQPLRVRGGAGGYGATSNDYGVAPKKKKSKWLTIGLPLLILVIVAAVLGGVLGSRAADDDDSSTSSTSNDSASKTTKGSSASTETDAGSAAASSVAAANGALARVATGTDTYMLPIYPTGTATSGYSEPTYSARAKHEWPADPDSPSTTSLRAHPRLIAPAYKWSALPDLIAVDAYLAGWNATIFANASLNYDADSIQYIEDGGLEGSGVLDIARELKLRVKNWAYAYKMTNDTKWVDRCWTELNVAMGNDSSIPFGDGVTRWNAVHFLDLAEFTSAFGIAYDWFFDAFTEEQKSTLRGAMVTFGLDYCVQALEGNATFSWWTKVNGNWNCVCNAGCTVGALAIVDEDTTGQAQKVLDLAVTNANGNCAQAVQLDGTWTETPNYWYFGTTGFAEMASALMTATGSDQGMLSANENFHKTGSYHMYVQGMTSLFNYADAGPNKYSSTANAMLFMGNPDVYNNASYTLYQRDQYDASEPWSMFWYDPSVAGVFWDGLPLDHHFWSGPDDWASMRDTWTSNDGIYAAMKAGNMTGHQTHGDIDAGDFVLDAMGQRWAGELGSGNYLSTQYFYSEAEDAERWLYYRKRTEGQNTIVLNYLNQNTTSQPTTTFASTGDAQGPSTEMVLSAGSTAYYTMDLTEAYNGTVITRGMRMLNQRKQFLIQTDIEAPDATNIQWRMHTNATISVSDDGLTATLTLDGKTMDVIITNPTDQGLKFESLEPIRYASDPPIPAQPEGEVGDQENKGVSVLTINMTGGTYSLQVVFNPQWSDMSVSDFITPANVALNDWTLTSHQ